MSGGGPVKVPRPSLIHMSIVIYNNRAWWHEFQYEEIPYSEDGPQKEDGSLRDRWGGGFFGSV